ncbi:MAG: DUF2341 domain-containing protein, partial [Kiritimatiellae bacterium]|nr:DUF2341 domain-containing protein [Kiritimatiellia bacterium]
CLYGDYDEARLCKGALSPERIAADYAAATDSGFFDYEAVESLAVGGIDPSVFARSLRLTVPASSVPAGVTIGRFPALVRLSEKIDGFRYEDFMSNGADLVFADESGRVLPHEIDIWNTEGESLVWVRVPALRAGGVFYAYWGGGKSTAVPADVWSGFAGVWHMKEPSGVVSDSTGNGLDATPSGALAAKNIGIDDGAVGLARKNGGTGEDGVDVRAYLSIPNDEALRLGDTFTASGFFRVTATKGWYRLFSRCGSGITGGWGQEVHCDNAENVLVYGDAAEKPVLNIPGLVGNWVHLAFVYGGNTCKVYANGALAGTLGIVPASDNGAPLALGCTSDGGDWCLYGDYDEARLCKGALSPERIAADYATAVRSDFFDYGSVEVLTVNPPVVDKPVLSRNEAGEMAVSVSMISGTGRVHARFVSAGATVDVPLSDGAVTGPVAYALAVPVDRLLSDRTYSVMAVGINASGGEIVAEGEETFYLGSLAVEKTADAAENGPVSGVFTVSRADTHGDLTVNYSFGGSAAAGVDYAGAAHGTVTIPAGASSAVVTVTPKVNAAVNADTAVVFAFADGFYPASGATASMAIANLPPAARQDFEKCIRFSFPMAFLAADETLENFPVLIRLSESIPGFSYGAFRLPRGGDMMFTDSSGTPIPSEISTWDASGTSLVWVSVPKLAKGTVIKMYYGNGVNPAGADVVKWPGYAGVWHLEEADGTAFDSAANSFDALAKRNGSSLPKKDLVAVADGAAGRGRVNQTGTSYYTTKRSYLSVSEAIDDGIGAQFSFSGWFRTTEGTEWREPLACKLADGFDNGWVVSRLSSTTDPETQKESDRRLAVTVGDRKNVEFTIPDMRNNWVHVFVSFDSEAAGETRRSVARIYANGAFIDSLVAGREIGDSGYPLTFGNIDSVSSGDVFNGQYDELRLKRGASSPNWVKAEYLAMTDPSFVTASAALPAVGGFVLIVR